MICPRKSPSLHLLVDVGGAHSGNSLDLTQPDELDAACKVLRLACRNRSRSIHPCNLQQRVGLIAMEPGDSEAPAEHRLDERSRR